MIAITTAIRGRPWDSLLTETPLGCQIAPPDSYIHHVRAEIPHDRHEAMRTLFARRAVDPHHESLSQLTLAQLIYRQSSTVARSPFVLYTDGTPNGRKVSVYLEELKRIYGDKVAYE